MSINNSISTKFTSLEKTNYRILEYFTMYCSLHIEIMNVFNNVTVGSMAGAHKTIITGPKGKSLHKEELTMSQAERDVQHRIKTNAPLQQRHASNRSVKTAAAQDTSKTSHTKNTTQHTTSKIPETTGDVQDIKVRYRIFSEHLIMGATIAGEEGQAFIAKDQGYNV